MWKVNGSTTGRKRERVVKGEGTRKEAKKSIQRSEKRGNSKRPYVQESGKKTRGKLL